MWKRNIYPIWGRIVGRREVTVSRRCCKACETDIVCIMILFLLMVIQCHGPESDGTVLHPYHQYVTLLKFCVQWSLLRSCFKRSLKDIYFNESQSITIQRSERESFIFLPRFALISINFKSDPPPSSHHKKIWFEWSLNMQIDPPW